MKLKIVEQKLDEEVQVWLKYDLHGDISVMTRYKGLVQVVASISKSGKIELIENDTLRIK